MSLAAPGPNPFKFLDSFGEDEWERFFGREDDVSRLVARLSALRTLVLYGRSGVGKTSFVLAGLVPALRARMFLPVYLRLFQHPSSDLLEQVARAVCAPSRGASLVALLRYGQKRSGRIPVLIIDQMEELFVRFPDPAHPERTGVLEVLRQAMTDRRAGARFLFSLRQDYVAELDELEPGVFDLLDNRFRLRGLSAFGARQAVLRPLRAAGIEVSPRLAQRLIDALAVHAYEPLVIQIVASELYSDAMLRHPDRREITVDDLTAAEAQARAGAPGPEGHSPSLFEHMLERYLQRLDASTPKGLRFVVRAALDAMITAAGTRRALTVAMLREALSVEASAEDLHASLALLEEHHVVRRDLRDGEAWFEPIHDRLALRLRPWLRRDRGYLELGFARQLVKQLASSPVWRESHDALLGHGQLEAVVGPHRDRLRLSMDERELLVQSAVVSRSGSLAVWAEKYGKEATSTLVLSLLTHPSAEVREGAALAVRSLSGGTRGVDEGWVEGCLQRALGDPEEAVRRTAAETLAEVASDAWAGRLREALEEESSRRAAVEVLLIWLQKGRPAQAFTQEQRLTARKLGSERALAAGKDDIELRVQKSRKHSIVASIMGWIFPGVVLLAFAVWTADPDNWRGNFYGLLFIELIVALIVGALLGPAVARVALRHELTPGLPRLWRAMLGVRTGLPFCAATLFSVFLAGTILEAPWQSLAPAVLMAPVQLVIVCLVMDLVQRSSRAFARWPWLFISGLGPLAGAGLSMASSLLFIVPSPVRAQPLAYLIAGVCALLSSVTVAIVLRSLQVSSARMEPPPRADTPRSEGLALGLLGLASLAGSGLLVLVARGGGIPCFAPRLLVTEPVTLEVSDFPPAHFWRLENPTNQVIFLHSQQEYAVFGVESEFSLPAIREDGIALVAPGISVAKARGNGDTRRGRVRLEPISFVNGGAGPTLAGVPGFNGVLRPATLRRLPLTPAGGEAHKYRAHLERPPPTSVFYAQVIVNDSSQELYEPRTIDDQLGQSDVVPQHLGIYENSILSPGLWVGPKVPFFFPELISPNFEVSVLTPRVAPGSELSLVVLVLEKN